MQFYRKSDHDLSSTRRKKSLEFFWLHSVIEFIAKMNLFKPFKREFLFIFKANDVAVNSLY